MGEQIEQFRSVHSNISEYLNDTADATMKKAVFLLSVGSNDIIDLGLALFTANDTQQQQYLNTFMTAYQTHLKVRHFPISPFPTSTSKLITYTQETPYIFLL